MKIMILTNHDLGLYKFRKELLESLLKDRKHQYRSCQIMNRFKIVHYYSKSSDTVHIVDIWDMLMNPEKQQRRI